MSNIDRREFLTRTGLTLAVAATPSGLKVMAMGETDTESGLFQPTVWYHLSTENHLTVMVNKVEMGQGTHTALPMIVADELDEKWEQVSIEQAPTRKEYYDPPRFTRMGTGGSGGVRGMYEHLRKAGAAGRPREPRDRSLERGGDRTRRTSRGRDQVQVEQADDG